MRLSYTLLILSFIATLGACAPQQTLHIMPEETLVQPHFKASFHHYPDNEIEPGFHFLDVYDPWEPMNRNIYALNATVDKLILLPATKTYELLIPSPVRKGVHNVFENLRELPRFANSILQGKGKKGAICLSRFIINSTFGLCGLFDLASRNEKLTKQHEDVGQTLGSWGMGNGPYLVLPLLGPSNMRDTVGYGGDSILQAIETDRIEGLFKIQSSTELACAMFMLHILDKRTDTAFRYYETGSPYEYELIRYMYTKKRELDIAH